MPRLRTLFGVSKRPRHHGAELSPRQAVVIERPRWNLTLFKVHFGLLTLKGYTKGEHVLRFEAIVHNTRTLHTGRVIENFPTIVARLAAMVERFTSMLDCVDVAFLPDAILDQLPNPCQIGAGRVGGVDLNNPRARAALSAVLALAVSPDGFTIGDLAHKVRSLTGQGEQEYTVRQAAYDLRNSAPNTSSSNPAGPAATRCPVRPPAPSLPYSPCETKSSHPSSPGSANQDPGGHPNHGPTSTATTKPSAPVCAPCSTTWQSAPPHRQQLVDQTLQVSRTFAVLPLAAALAARARGCAHRPFVAPGGGGGRSGQELRDVVRRDGR